MATTRRWRSGPQVRPSDRNQPVRDRRLEESWEINPSVSVRTASEAAGRLASVLPCNTCDREDERFEEIGGQSWGGGGGGVVDSFCQWF